MLSQLEFLQMPGDLENWLYPSSRPGLKEKLGQIEVADVTPDILVLYLQPLGDGGNVITFREFADYVAEFDDPVSQRFARSLRDWQTRAGKEVPGEM